MLQIREVFTNFLFCEFVETYGYMIDLARTTSRLKRTNPIFRYFGKSDKNCTKFVLYRVILTFLAMRRLSAMGEMGQVAVSAQAELFDV